MLVSMINVILNLASACIEFFRLIKTLTNDFRTSVPATWVRTYMTDDFKPLIKLHQLVKHVKCNFFPPRERNGILNCEHPVGYHIQDGEFGKKEKKKLRITHTLSRILKTQRFADYSKTRDLVNIGFEFFLYYT